MFRSARLRLTAWYLLIIMVISLLFSFAIFRRFDREFDLFIVRLGGNRAVRQERLLPPPPNRGILSDNVMDRERIQKAMAEARSRVGMLLMVVNGIIFFGAGGAGYFLAGRTLKPIKNMVDEQERFIADSSHEFRTPLTSLRTSLEVDLRNKHLTVAQATKRLRENLEDVKRLQRLSDRLLRLTQPQVQNTAEIAQMIPLLDILQSAKHMVAGQAKSQNIQIAMHVPKDVQVSGAREELVEVFTILFENAIKYSRKGGSVHVSSKELDNEKVQITVQDVGACISAEHIPHIFDRFYRADKSRTSNGVHGFGLGLSIAKKIVNEHNGSISVASIPGNGSTFTVLL